MENSTEIGSKSLFYKIWLFFAALTFFYAFYFQYGVRAIGSAMIVLCGLLIFCALVQIFVHPHDRIRKNIMLLVLFYVFASVIITIGLTANGNYGVDVGIRMIEYALAAYSIYLLLAKKPRFINVLFWVICISVTLLAINSLVRGVVISSSGATGIESLNTNLMSSFFLMMFFCSFVLLAGTAKRSTTLLICAMDCIVIVAQVVSASRRGFVVMCIFLFLSITFGVIPYKSKNNSRRRFLLYMVLLLVLAAALIIFQQYILDNTILGARLLGSYDTGDAARARYQAYAFSQFKEHPLLGIGLGGVAYGIGVYSHSLYYEILACNGIVMSCVLIFALLGIGYGLFKRQIGKKAYASADRATYITRIALIYWLCILISGIAVVMIYDLYFYLSLAFLTVVLGIDIERRSTNLT